MQQLCTRKDVNEIINERKYKLILDIGPSKNPIKSSTHLLDYIDNSKIFPDKVFVCHDINKSESLPFEDKYFDFIFCSHVLEHVDNPINLLNEINRIGKSGIIIVPTKLSDNLYSIDATKFNDVYLNDRYGHKFWFDYGKFSSIEISKRSRIIRRIPQNENELKKLFFEIPNFYELCFYWEDDIIFNFLEKENISKNKFQIRIGYSNINFFTLIQIKLNDWFLDRINELKIHIRKIKYRLIDNF